MSKKPAKLTPQMVVDYLVSSSKMKDVADRVIMRILKEQHAPLADLSETALTHIDTAGLRISQDATNEALQAVRIEASKRFKAALHSDPLNAIVASTAAQDKTIQQHATAFAHGEVVKARKLFKKTKSLPIKRKASTVPKKKKSLPTTSKKALPKPSSTKTTTAKKTQAPVKKTVKPKPKPKPKPKSAPVKTTTKTSKKATQSTTSPSSSSSSSSSKKKSPVIINKSKSRQDNKPEIPEAFWQALPEPNYDCGRDVDQRVKIFWADDQAYYSGKIIGFDRLTKKHHIRYDDNEEEDLFLYLEKFEWLNKRRRATNPDDLMELDWNFGKKGCFMALSQGVRKGMVDGAKEKQQQKREAQSDSQTPQAKRPKTSSSLNNKNQSANKTSAALTASRASSSCIPSDCEFAFDVSSFASFAHCEESAAELPPDLHVSVVNPDNPLDLIGAVVAHDQPPVSSGQVRLRFDGEKIVRIVQRSTVRLHSATKLPNVASVGDSVQCCGVDGSANWSSGGEVACVLNASSGPLFLVIFRQHGAFVWASPSRINKSS